MKIGELVSTIEQIAHPSLQEEYDNAGLLTSHSNEITNVLVSLDCTESIIDEAIERNCNVVIAHHPIIFRGLKTITGKNYIEKTIIKAIKNDIAIYAIHTNLDNVHNGVNAKMAEVIGLRNLKILSPKKGLLYKLQVYVPEKDLENVKTAIFEAGGGEIGNYSECSYSSKGIGSFKPNDNATPSIGIANRRETLNEYKLEVIVPTYLIDSVVKAMKKAHSYEEVAYEVIGIANEHQLIGSGMIGELGEEIEAEAFLKLVKNKFNCGVVKHTQIHKNKVKNIAICGGAGIFLLKSAIRQGADVFITSDVKYHEFFDAENRIILADIGHFESEKYTIDLIVDELSKKISTFASLKALTVTNPVNYL